MTKKTKKKGSKKKTTVEEQPTTSPEDAPEEGLEGLELPPYMILQMPAEPRSAAAPSPIRVTGLVGDVTEDKAADVLSAIISLMDKGRRETMNEDGTVEVSYLPFEIVVSTNGGSASEMFSLFDLINYAKERYEVRTLGLGKVMSAGVPLLAAGTKGSRRIGRNCRVMLHSVVAAFGGSMHDLDAEMDEVRWAQEKYIDALVQTTDMTKAYIRKLLKRKVNVYLTAQEAVDLGIADEII